MAQVFDSSKSFGTQYSLTVTGSGWTTVRAVGVPYQTDDGAWRLRLNISGDVTGTTTFTGNVTGVVFKNIGANYYHAVAGDAFEVGVSDRWVKANATSNSNVIRVMSQAGNFTRVSLSGDVELESKPSWAP